MSHESHERAKKSHQVQTKTKTAGHVQANYHYVRPMHATRENDHHPVKPAGMCDALAGARQDRERDLTRETENRNDETKEARRSADGNTSSRQGTKAEDDGEHNGMAAPGVMTELVGRNKDGPQGRR
ncbi:hypothetical protein ACROYT_G010737 [Oculina patagonica]